MTTNRRFGMSLPSPPESVRTVEAQKKVAVNGNFVALLRGNSDIPTVNGVIQTEGIRGYVKRYMWSELEPEEDQYTLAQLDEDVAYCTEKGLRLIVFLEDKSFNPTRIPTPLYLRDYTPDCNTVNAEQPTKGWVGARWDPYYSRRFMALVVKLAQTYRAEPGFHGLCLQETALGLDQERLDRTGAYAGAPWRYAPYTLEAYIQSYIALFQTLHRALWNKRLYWFANFFARDGMLTTLPRLLEVSKFYDAVPCVVDVIPDYKALVSRVYPFFKDLPLAGANASPESYWYRSPALIKEYATANLSAKTFFWTYDRNVWPLVKEVLV